VCFLDHLEPDFSIDEEDSGIAIELKTDKPMEIEVVW
jgi:hypothetical protein